MPNLSIVVVNYKTGDLLRRLFVSLHEHVNADFELIVWDNNSQEPLDWLEVEFSAIVIKSQKNIGFGCACNNAAKLANTENILFLNPDVVALGDFVTPLLERLQMDCKIGALGCLQISATGVPVQSGEHFHSPIRKVTEALRNRVTRRGRILPFGFSSDKEWLPVDYVSGACLLVRKELFWQMKGFDPNYFMYYEEEDLQLQMHRAGYQSFLATHMRIQHDPGSSHKGKDTWKPLFWNSYIHYLKKNWGLSGYVLSMLVKVFIYYRLKCAL